MKKITQKKIKKTLLFIALTLGLLCLQACSLTGGNGDVAFPDILPSDVKQMVLDEQAPEALRYTVVEDGVTKTYITDDVELIQRFIAASKKAKVNALELALLDPSKGGITFCGTMMDSNGLVYNSYIPMEDGYFMDSNGNYYVETEKSKLHEVLETIKQESSCTFYEMDIDSASSKLKGYWLSDTLEVSFSQSLNGYYYLSFYIDGETNYVGNNNFRVISYEKEGSEITLGCVDDEENEYEFTILMGSDTITIDGNRLERAMME